MAIEITESELLSALASAYGAEPEGAKTTRELCAELGLPKSRVQKALQAVQAQGRLVVHHLRRPDLAGRMGWVVGYTISPPPKKKR